MIQQFTGYRIVCDSAHVDPETDDFEDLIAPENESCQILYSLSDDDTDVFPSPEAAVEAARSDGWLLRTKPDGEDEVVSEIRCPECAQCTCGNKAEWIVNEGRLAICGDPDCMGATDPIPAP